MHITITGATGFIGKRLIPLLLEMGHEVRILGRTPKTGFPPEVRFYLWNATEGGPPSESLKGADAVVHLAGESVSQRWTPQVRKRIRESRVLGTRNLVETLGKLEQPPATLVSVSAVGYYGDRGEEELDESSKPGEGFLAEVCQEWEAEAARAAEFGVRVVRPRIGMVLGIGGGALEQMLPPFKMFMGGQLGNGKQWMSWVHLEDLVSLLRHALETPEVSGPMNAIAPNPVRNKQFTRILARTIRRPALFTVPEQGLKALFGDMAEIMLASQRVLPRVAQESGYKYLFPDLGQALKHLLG